MIEKFALQKTSVWPFMCSKEQNPNQRVKDIVDLCCQSKLDIVLTPQAISERWKMLLTYSTNNAVSAVSGLTFGDVFDTDEGKDMLFDIAKEVALVAKLENVDNELFNEQIALETVENNAKNRSEYPGTFLRDCKSKRTTEIDETAGALLRKAKEHGVTLPYMKTIWSIIRLKEENYGNEYD